MLQFILPITSDVCFSLVFNNTLQKWLSVLKVSRTLQNFFYFVGNLAQNDYTDFLISLKCPELNRAGSVDGETIDCGSDAVIDIIWARVADLWATFFCDRNIKDDLTSNTSPYCTVHLPFLM